MSILGARPKSVTFASNQTFSCLFEPTIMAPDTDCRGWNALQNPLNLCSIESTDISFKKRFMRRLAKKCQFSIHHRITVAPVSTFILFLDTPTGQLQANARTTGIGQETHKLQPLKERAIFVFIDFLKNFCDFFANKNNHLVQFFKTNLLVPSLQA